MARGAQSKITVAVKADGTKATVKELESLNNALKKTEEAQKKLGKTQDDVTKKSKKLSFATLEAARAFEDFQFAGIKGIVNNLSQMGVLLGGPLIGAIGTTLVVAISSMTGAFSKASTATREFTDNFDLLITSIENETKAAQASFDIFKTLSSGRDSLLKQEIASRREILKLNARIANDDEAVQLLEIEELDISQVEKAKRSAEIKARGAVRKRDVGSQAAAERFVSSQGAVAGQEAVVSKLLPTIEAESKKLATLRAREAARDAEEDRLLARNISLRKELAEEQEKQAKLAEERGGLTDRTLTDSLRGEIKTIPSRLAGVRGKREEFQKAVLEQESVVLATQEKILQANNDLTLKTNQLADAEEVLIKTVGVLNSALRKAEREGQAAIFAATKKEEAEAKKAADKAKREADAAAKKAASAAATQERGLVSEGRSLASALGGRFGVSERDKKRIKLLAEDLDRPGDTQAEIDRLISIAERILGRQDRNETVSGKRLIRLEQFMARTERNLGSNNLP